MYFSIDRKTAGQAILLGEDAQPLEVPLSALPQNAREGDMLLYQNGQFLSAPEKTEERRRQVANALARLLGGNDE